MCGRGHAMLVRGRPRNPVGLPPVYSGRRADNKTETRAQVRVRIRNGLAIDESSPLADATRRCRVRLSPGVDELLGLGLADSARQIVIDREWSISVPEGLSAREVGMEIAKHRQHATAERAQHDPWSKSLRPCCSRGSAGRRVRLVGRQVRHRFVAFSSERFSARERLLVDSRACPVRSGTPRGLLWKSMSHWETSAQQDER